MKKLLLAGALLCGATLFSQTTIFSDNFESSSSNWSFSGTGDNAWVVNNSFISGWDPFILNTPNQPAGFTNSPQSYYLHIVSGTGCGSLGACNANFDTGSASNQNAAMATGISTVGMNTVTVNFWYLCAGAMGVSYGSLEYSINGGGAWINAGNYSGVSTWTQANVTIAAADNQADFRIRFKWQNGGSGSDPAFAVDEVTITAIPGSVTNDIVTGNISTTSWCQGSDVLLPVNFTSTGTYGMSNVYTAQLSDASGSFASPTAIGTLTSSLSGNLSVPSTISGMTPLGAGYRIRVVASDPSTIGSDNGSNLTIHALPNVSQAPFNDVCVYVPEFALSGGSPASGSYSGQGVVGNNFNPAVAGIGTHTITYTFVDGNGCSNSAQESIVVDACASLLEIEFAAVLVYPNPAETHFNIDGVPTIQLVELVDLSGRVIRSFKQNIGSYDVTAVPNGSYLLRISTNGGVISAPIYIH
jgi:hypothetical protein